VCVCVYASPVHVNRNALYLIPQACTRTAHVVDKFIQAARPRPIRVKVAEVLIYTTAEFKKLHAHVCVCVCVLVSVCVFVSVCVSVCTCICVHAFD